VAQGDFTRRQPVTSTDELGVLTVSFNTMSAQLLEAQQKTEESRRATETTRAYLESILGNLSAGVLAFDDGYRLRTANASAAVILQQPLAELSGVPCPIGERSSLSSRPSRGWWPTAFAAAAMPTGRSRPSSP
jgi:nitrogen fixation/metabolism regulation signal transduction histidine kinase